MRVYIYGRRSLRVISTCYHFSRGSKTRSATTAANPAASRLTREHHIPWSRRSSQGAISAVYMEGWLAYLAYICIDTHTRARAFLIGPIDTYKYSYIGGTIRIYIYRPNVFFPLRLIWTRFSRSWIYSYTANVAQRPTSALRDSYSHTQGCTRLVYQHRLTRFAPLRYAVPFNPFDREKFPLFRLSTSTAGVKELA